MNQALAERAIRDLEICHYLLNRNLCALYCSLTTKTDSRVYGCGEAAEDRLTRAFLFARLLQCWLDEAGVYPELNALFEQVSALLGKRTDSKVALVTHLVHRLHDNGYKAYPDEKEDFKTLESRIQHLEVCHPDWEDDLVKLLHEIGQGKMLYDWNKNGGFFACGRCGTPNAFPKAFMQTIAERHGIQMPSEITQESVTGVFRQLMEKIV